ncbi:MAG: 16S rRNA (uracil(1498)-N(3))-methyltransferase [Bacteroidetes bacterium]|nr:16S rRNA (uracil(1498)-N(3))-methyltransferase [Bacteroidota bacterium]
MECLYVPELTSDIEQTTIVGDEFKHIWALRLRLGETIMLSNGKGICSITQLVNISKSEAIVKVIDVLHNFGENQTRIGLGLGILDSRDRMEFAVEKSVELGITDFYPIICEFSQKKIVSIERLQHKAIAALKQCKRAYLPIFYQPMTLKQLLENSNRWNVLFVGDVNGIQVPQISSNDSALILIGTEGGFSENETKLLNEESRTINIKLAHRRLRAETAAIVALSLVSNINNQNI